MMAEYRSRENEGPSPLLGVRGSVLAIVMAGGMGERLRPLTERRSKAAVPFGGMFRLIDFVLGNLVNSGVQDIGVLVQYKSESLEDYLEQGWSASPAPWRISLRRGGVEGRNWYRGTADAVTQNIDYIRARRPDLVLVFGADHVYTMDVRQMLDWHLSREADVTVSTIPMPSAEACQFGTASIGPDWRVHEFEEKAPYPRSIPGRLGQSLVSMGNYVFNTDVLLEALEDDAARADSHHDFGRDVLPRLVSRRRVLAYDFRTNRLPGLDGPSDYWRDVGTIQTFYQANLDLIDPFCHLHYSSNRWPLRPSRSQPAPARLIARHYGEFGVVKNSLVASTAVIDGAFVRDSIIGPDVRILSGAIVEGSVLLGRTIVNERARIRRAIIDMGNSIEEDEKVGFDLRSDLSRYSVDDESGIVVLGQGESPMSLDLQPVYVSPPLSVSMRM